MGRGLLMTGNTSGIHVDRDGDVVVLTIDRPDRLPLIAAVAANAVGGGFELMLKCDMAVAAAGIQFALPETGRGMVPGGGATLLPARVSVAIAMELAVLGAPMPVERAYQLGL